MKKSQKCYIIFFSDIVKIFVCMMDLSSACSIPVKILDKNDISISTSEMSWAFLIILSKFSGIVMG